LHIILQAYELLVQALSETLAAISGEALVVHVLRACQSMATVAGVLGQHEVMLAYLAAVCFFTVDNQPAPPEATHANASGVGAATGAGGGETGAQSHGCPADSGVPPALEEATSSNSAPLRPRGMCAFFCPVCGNACLRWPLPVVELR
jgi:hypothetical protein